MSFTTHDEYFAAAAPEARSRLVQIQRKVEAIVPGATRCMSYRMPAFRGKRVFFFFAAFREHIGIYPPVRHDAALIAELGPHRGPKGNLTFRLDEPLPLALIGRVAAALHREVELKQAKGAKAPAKKAPAKKAPAKKAPAKKAPAKRTVTKKPSRRATSTPAGKAARTPRRSA